MRQREKAATPLPKKSIKHVRKTLELIHSDVCGSIKTSSIGNATYFVTFIDDRTR